jgi:hypothetical protein
MSSQSAARSRKAVQDALNAIMRHLDNIELKLEPLQPLQTRVEALEAVMTDQEQHQQELQDAVQWVKMTQSTPGGTRDDDTGDLGHDPHTTNHKMDFPNFNSASERFFHVRRTPNDKRVAFTAFYLLNGAQLWFHRMELNGGSPSW